MTRLDSNVIDYDTFGLVDRPKRQRFERTDTGEEDEPHRRSGHQGPFYAE